MRTLPIIGLAILIAAIAATIALATPGSGTPGPLVARGTLDGNVKLKLRASSNTRDGAVASTDLAAKKVPATANIFGSGFAAAPQPAGGGGGTLPPVLRLPRGSADAAPRIVTFPKIVGKVNPIVRMAPYNGPGGDGVGPTDVSSWPGISGIVHAKNGMFLVGVFLTDARPKRPSPPRLDFTGKEQFDMLAPRIGQTFFIGDGKNRSYRVPSAATRLFLGFADGFLYRGAPGWYGNNAGSLSVTVEVTTE
ncbi:MAG: hypothetical protein MSC30_17220 [Gaiellaceae bacterium MAG52_C11]|nr:hypothetical protein [Candidatus Gaiellasilicea maunaloa]